MKIEINWVAIAFVFSIAGLTGCVSAKVSQALANKNHITPVLSDEIIAIGKPDVLLANEMGREHIVAFIGLKNSYLLYKGGEELERIAQLKLDGRIMYSDASGSANLYLKDKRIWGDLTLTYPITRFSPPEELAELEKGGFKLVGGSQYEDKYRKCISIEGVLYPAIKIPQEQLSTFKVRRTFNLYAPDDASLFKFKKILEEPIKLTAALIDVALVPVYVSSMGVILVILMIHPPS